MIDLQQINVWGTVAAALAAFALGGVWFSVLFGKAWARSLGKDPKELGSPMVAMSLFLLTALLQAFAIALLFQAAGLDTTGLGLAGGLILGAIVFLSTLADAGFTGALKARWWWIQASYRLLGILLVGAIVGASAPENSAHRLKRSLEKAGESIQKGLNNLGDSFK